MSYKVLFLLLIPAVLGAQATGPDVDRERGQTNSEALWRQALGGEVTGLPTVQAQSVVMTLDGGNIKAYSSAGTPLWNYSARGRVSPFVTRSREGTSYISRTNGVLIAINRSGRELWRQNPGGALTARVVSGWDGRLFVPTEKKISCYTAAGKLLWARQFDHAVMLAPFLDQTGGIVCALENNELLRIDPFGNIARRALEKAPQAAASFANGRYLVLYKSGGFEFLDFSGAEGELMYPLPSPPLAAVSRGNKAAICMADGRVILVSGDNGDVFWTGESHIAVERKRGAAPDSEAAVIYDERGVYVLSLSGATGFTEDGRRLWFTTIQNAAALPAFADDGILYSGGRDWILYAYKLEDRARQEKQSLYGPAPQGSYGLGTPPPSPWADDYFRFDEAVVRAQFAAVTAAIQAGEVGADETAWTAYLMETASGGGAAAASRAPLQYRVAALDLLAQIGSRETIPYLVTLFNRDKESVVRAAAARAVGVIGVDPDGIALEAFMGAVSPASIFKDEQTLTAVAQAAGALSRFSGPPLSDMGVRILTLLTAAGQPKNAQQQAQRELRGLK